MTEFGYPTSNELRTIEQDKMPRLLGERPIFDFFPSVNHDAVQLTWEQEDNWLGLQQVRGIGGDPPRVSKVGIKRYTLLPGVYGEFEPIDEIELMERRQFGTWGTPIDISDLTVRAQDRLLMRRRDRMEAILWSLAVAGTFSVAGPSGAILHTDAYTTQSYNATTWATLNTATPLVDFRAAQLLSRGHSVDFGAGARAFMNRTTANNLLANTNASDLGGKLILGGQTVNSLTNVQQILTGEGLPSIEVYDEGYLAEPSGTFTLFIPDGKVVVVGRRPGGAPIGEYRMVRNVNNSNMAPGPYTAVIDRGQDGPGRRIPRSIEVHDGHNGGPVLYYPSAIIVMDVS